MRRWMITAGLVAGVGLATATTSDSQTQQATSAASADSTPLRVAPTETRYTLVAVTGKPLPVEIEKELRCREEVTAGALTLRSDGRWLLETSTKETCGDRVEQDSDTEDGVYRSESGALRFFDDDGKENRADWGLGREIDLDELQSGSLGADGTLTVKLADNENHLVFRPEAPGR